MYSCRVKMDRLVTNKNNVRYKFVANYQDKNSRAVKFKEKKCVTINFSQKIHLV